MRSHRTPSRRRAFTFVELLFAMAILSIGMIGVAAAVYVGVDQTKTTLDETAAASVARQAAAVMGQVMTAANAPQGGGSTYRVIHNLNPPDFEKAVLPLQIAGSDRRLAWTPLIRYEGGSPTSDLIVVVVRNQSGDDYSAKDITAYTNGVPDISSVFPPSLVPRSVPMDFKANRVRVSGPTPMVAGAFVVLADAGWGDVNGRIIRVAGQDADGWWSLAPGQDLADFSGDISGVNGLVVGRGYADVTRPEKGYAGGNQAVAIYSTIVSLR